MLSPDDRLLFHHALRPPEGYTFDTGIGTTFTLDLNTLLITPLSFALYDYDTSEQALHNPFSLLDSLQKYSDRLTIFCQAGRIRLPIETQPMLSFLEKMVVEVQSPRGGVFHPKIWLLRYTSPNNPPVYRMLNMSRNLTFDRSWDLIMQMDGELQDRIKGYGVNRPLGDFVSILPSLAVHSPSNAVLSRIKLIQEEIRRVKFITPINFDNNFKFHPIGIPGYRSNLFSQPFGRMLVISPFLANDFLQSAIQEKEGNILISRLESIDELNGASRDRFEKIFVLSELAEEDPIELDDPAEPGTVIGEQALGAELSGLHAKLFVWEDGWDAGWLIGSANATDTAFRKNVEFMVELHGKKARVGIDKILGNEEDQKTLLRLIEEYKAPDKDIPIDRDQKRVEVLIDEIRTRLLQCSFELEVVANGEVFDLLMRSSRSILAPEGDYSIECRPISLKEGVSQTIDFREINTVIKFKNLSLVGLTSFMGFTIKAQVGKAKATTQFVFLLPVKGLPAERDRAVLSTVLSSRSQFLWYLRLLLSEDNMLISPSPLLPTRPDEGPGGSGWGAVEIPLLEELMRALSRSNEAGGKIDRIAELVDRLNGIKNPDGETIIPPEFLMVWEKIQQVRQGVL